MCSFNCVLEWIVACGKGSRIDFISLLSLLRGCTVGCRQLQTAFSWSLKYEIAISPCNAFIMIPCAFVQCGIFHQTMDWNKQGKILIGYLMQESARKKSCHRRQEEIRSQPGWELKLLWKHYSIYGFFVCFFSHVCVMYVCVWLRQVDLPLLPSWAPTPNILASFFILILKQNPEMFKKTKAAQELSCWDMPTCVGWFLFSAGCPFGP